MNPRGYHESFAVTAFRLVVPLTLAAMVIVVASSNQRTAILNTVVLGFGANLLALPCGIFLGRVCTYAGWIPTFVRLFNLAFLFVPLFVHVSAWDSAVGKLGWLTDATWSVNTIPMGTWAMAIWVHGLAAVPFVSVVTWYGLQGSIRIHEEQAELDATQFSVFWYVTMPRLLPLVGVCAIWVFVTCAREIAVTDIYRVGTLAEQVYLGYSLGDLDTLVGPGFAMIAIAMIGAAVAAVVVPYFNDLISSHEQLSRGTRNRQLGSGNRVIASIALLVLVVVPAINLTTRAARFVENVEQSPMARYSMGNFFRVVAQVPEIFVEEIYWSSVIAGVSSCVILSCCVGLVWYSLQSRFWRLGLMIVFVVSCSLPGPVIGSMTLWLRSSIDIHIVTWLFDRTIMAPLITNILFCLPVSLVLVWFVLRNTAADSLEHAELEGAGNISRLLYLAIAGNFRSLFGVFLITFATCFGELSASQLAIPPGIDTVPRRMLGMLHSGVNDHTAGLTIVSVLFIMGVVAVGYGFVYWNQRINEQ